MRSRGALAAVIITVLGTGCLSPPTGRTADAQDNVAAWPAPKVSITSARVADVNGDHIDDLLLASTIADTAERGIWILLGGPDFGAHYQGRVITTETSPVAFEIADLGGSADLDLIVMGGTLERTNVLAYPGTGPVAFGAPMRFDTTSFGINVENDAGYIFVRVDDLLGEGVPDLLLASGGALFTAPVPSFTPAGIEDLALTQIPGHNSTYFIGLNDAYTVPRGDGRDLVVDHIFLASVFPGGDLAIENRKDTDRRGTSHNFSADVDLDGDGVPEQIGGMGGFLGLEQPFPIDQHADFSSGQDTAIAGDEVIGFAVDRIDNDANDRYDAIYLARDKLEDQLTIHVLPQLRLDTSGALPRFDSTAADALHYTLPIALQGEVMVTGNFDAVDDGTDPRELLVIGHDGKIVCLHVDIDSIETCDATR